MPGKLKLTHEWLFTKGDPRRATMWSEDGTILNNVSIRAAALPGLPLTEVGAPCRLFWKEEICH